MIYTVMVLYKNEPWRTYFTGKYSTLEDAEAYFTDIKTQWANCNLSLEKPDMIRVMNFTELSASIGDKK
jgi:hypothetical protein